MMDGLSAAATVLAVLTATAKFLGLLQDTKEAGKEVEELKKQMTSLYASLILLKNVESSLRQSPHVWDDALRSLGIENGPLAQYSQTLASLTTKIGKKRNRIPVLSLRFKKELQEALARIVQLESTINMHFSVAQLHVLPSPAPKKVKIFANTGM